MAVTVMRMRTGASTVWTNIFAAGGEHIKNIKQIYLFAVLGNTHINS